METKVIKCLDGVHRLLIPQCGNGVSYFEIGEHADSIQIIRAREAGTYSEEVPASEEEQYADAVSF